MQTKQLCIRDASAQEKLPNFGEDDFVLFTQNDFKVGEKLALQNRGPKNFVKAIDDFLYQIVDLPIEDLEKALIS